MSKKAALDQITEVIVFCGVLSHQVKRWRKRKMILPAITTIVFRSRGAVLEMENMQSKANGPELRR
jgi:hypothetical protein